MGKNVKRSAGKIGTKAFSVIPAGAVIKYYNDTNKRAGRAASDAAAAQQSEAQRQFTYNEAISRQSGEQLDRATVAGLLSLDRDIGNQEKNLARQEQLISQIDPTIVEASQQALKLLRGEEAASLRPLKAQRDQQRQKLLASLREQLGPGAETSTAGIQALTSFDAESANLFGGAQQSALTSLGNAGSQFTSMRPDMFREIAGLSGFGQQKYNLGANQAQFGLQQLNAMQGSQAQMFNTAGAQYVGDMVNAQQRQAMNNQIIQTGTQLGAAYMTGGASLAAGGAQKMMAPGGQAGGSYFSAGNTA